ncbi:hypothetical protein C7S18_04200 [Ahniella affigens]|uniref:Zinc finger CHC2-type domain-containing protein n=1 Tax=Ahniella affigens TaxID=2021234 RepID=A0A2P1PNN6_9GAMM|nr:hypothetical protein C7S18_04200 [Ahniella affigens]
MRNPRSTHAPTKRGAVVGFGESRPRNHTANRIPQDWRQRLPEAERYYRGQIAKLSKPNGAGWAQGAFPFHEDRNASLSVHTVSGFWRCFAGCGGGDQVGFHMKRYGLDFRTAVLELIKGAA